jgi:hypothetical protein
MGGDDDAHRRKPSEVTKEEWHALRDEHRTALAVERATGYAHTSVLRYWNRFGIDYNESRATGPTKEMVERIEACFGSIKPYPDAETALYPALDRQRLKLWRKWSNKVRKVLVISDTHHPYLNAEHLREALKRDGDACLCVIAGDFFHAEAFSPFRDKATFPFEMEWEQGLEVLTDLSQFFPIIVTRANHERRLEKALRMLPREAAKYVLDRAPNLVQALIGDLRERVGKGVAVDGIYDTWLKIGDAVIAHADDFSQVPMRTATNVSDYMRINWQDIGVGNPPRVVVQAHTHHQGKCIYQGVMCFEAGCLCHDQDYRRLGKLGPGKKERWQRGYVVLEFENGVSDVNASRFVALDFR